jgi:prepilin-type N-terminal cleavage/methylation domain-containing protein
LRAYRGEKMKRAFTMIEMIFVIVILGILAAIAIPRYLAISQSTHETKLKAFVATLNRTVGETLWSRSLSEGKDGSIKSYESIKKYVDIPIEINGSDINMSNCGSDYQTIAESNTTVTVKKYLIKCKDGNITTAPAFELIRVEDNAVLVSREN